MIWIVIYRTTPIQFSIWVHVDWRLFVSKPSSTTGADGLAQNMSPDMYNKRDNLRWLIHVKFIYQESLMWFGTVGSSIDENQRNCFGNKTNMWRQNNNGLLDSQRIVRPKLTLAWWRHQIKTFSALLALCAGNLPVTGDSPHKGQWRGALLCSLICVWINGWVNNP